ncbi:BstXI family restriction endonuclease [Anoxybacillus gonensis]|uniref:BstXI family restriction endonuclease n=1 Tax=Anoxybacillus gonensis TaxID=198467 RepID=UPI0002BE4C43|nr:BstXI family restriction endonuclease [Anoxybacillus gonensis]EMI09203.1 hypothetical protein F510_2757 [Anoxybacillus gonensis]
MKKSANPWKEIFPKQFIKKIDKTGEARGGKGIYKRRNNRNYRVIMHLSTFRRIIETNPEFLNQFENGYAVRISPEEYFEPTTSLPDEIELGKNAFVYYKTKSSYEKYPPRKEWSEVVELYTSNQKPEGITQEWIGEYACFINNAESPKISTICGTNNTLPAEKQKALKEKYNLTCIPKQAGLGNFDYDYATKEETQKIKYQLTYLMLSVEGMDDYLYNLCLNDVTKKEYEFSKVAYSAATKGKDEFIQLFNSVKKNIEDFCKKHNLLDFNKLESIRAWDKIKNQPVCPLCLETLVPQDFLEIDAQAEGREEEDNTRSKISLMHIRALKPGELNHRTYNLGWGHRHCNTIQEDYDIVEVIQKLRRIVKNNEGKIPEENTIPIEKVTPKSL